jgi:PEGA domain
MVEGGRKTMKTMNLVGIAAVVLFLAAGIGAASAYTLKLGNLYIPTTGGTGEIPLTLDTAPEGIAGYSVTFHLSNPAAAEIRQVKAPKWADQSFVSISPGTNDVTLRLADVGDAIPATASPPAGGIALGSVVVLGMTKASSSEITVVVNQMDADNGAVILPAVTEGIVDVESPPGWISVTTTGANGAQINLDGNPVAGALTPGQVQAPVGSHQVSVSMANYVASPTEQTVDVVSEQMTPVSFSLLRPVTINVRVGPTGIGTMVTLDNDPALTKPANPTASFTNQPEGSHTVTASATGYYSKTATNSKVIPPGWSVSLTLTKATNDIPPYGSISVNSVPDGARVSIDGKDAEVTTSAKVEMPPGDHTVSVTLAGYKAPEAKTVTVVSGATVKVDFTLEQALPAKVVILPRTMNIGNKGKFLAFVKLPDQLNAADVDKATVICNGAPAERLIRWKVVPHVFAAIFSRSSLVDKEPGDEVPFTVMGTVKMKGGTKGFSGTDLVRVITNNGKGKEETEGVEQMSDAQILTKFKPSSF